MTTPLGPDDPRRLGQYHLRRRLGAGGMGTVFLAHDADDRRVAIKLIRPELAADPAFRARFRSEVRRARQVPPFCTAAVLDADPEHPTPYLVVEYVEGASLAEMVRRDGPLRGGDLHSVAIGVATALAAIHSAGVIHRDLKPANVLLSLGTPKVIDFGIARAAEAPTEHTRPDQMVGTIAYMAPERFATGADRRPPEPAMDVFAWGVLVAFAATGRTPFAADSPVATAARILTQPPDLDGLDAPIRALVAAALAKDPSRRPSAHELLSRLLAAGAADQAGAVDPQLQWAALAMRNNADAATAEAEEAAEAWAWVARRRRRRRFARSAATVTALTALLLALSAAGATLLDRRAGRPGADPFRSITLADPLRTPGTWRPAGSSDPSDACLFAPAGMSAQRRLTPSQRCLGPERSFANPIIAVNMTVPDAGTCAAVWLRVTSDGAYRVAICPDYLALDAEDGAGITAINKREVDSRSWAESWPTLTIVARGPYIDVDLEGTGPLRSRVPSVAPYAGRLALGVVRDDAYDPGEEDSHDPLNEYGYASFADLRVWEP
ncbi:serine/threonine-protein kinase [Actinoplanes sp. NPDC023936]|uniref:serine/threonine-protein kinase n=1 Tax=Actinoplanes sp. NPDC023936 TaxID=3154910 RepID=UPI0033FB7F42